MPPEQTAHQPIPRIRQPHHVERFSDAARTLGAPDKIKTRRRQRIFIAGEFGVSGHELRHVRDMSPHRPGLARGIETGQAAGTRCGRQHGCDHLHERAPSGAVRSDQREDLSCRNRERDMIHRDHAAIHRANALMPTIAGSRAWSVRSRYHFSGIHPDEQRWNRV
jgi:hypothetical protein